jgi:hypothetical protein
MNASSTDLDDLPLTPPLPLPEGQIASDITSLFASVRLERAPRQEVDNYWRQDWKRFAYTYGLISERAGSCLELGANPYFTTMLLRYFTTLDLTLANYFGPHFGANATQALSVKNPSTGERDTLSLDFEHFNIVHDNVSASLFSLEAIVPLVKFRENDLGQYLFLRSRNSGAARSKRPAWLYRSYPPGELES